MFKALLKKQFKEFFVGITTGRKSKGSKKLGKAGFIALYAICFISLAFAFFGMSLQIIDAVAITGQNWLFYTLITVAALAFAVIGSAFTAYTSIYNAKDNELLLSMPIPPLYILITRIITIFVLALMFEAVVYIPAMIVYWITYGATVLNVISPVIVMLGLTLLATIISCFMGWVIGLIAARTKNKNIATVVVSLLLICGYYVFYFNIQKILANVVLNINNMKFGMHIIGDAATGKVLPLIIFVIVVALLFAIMCYILSNSFISIATKKVAEKKIAYNRKTLQQTGSVKKVLLRKELKHFKNSAVYMLNCGLGVLIMPAIGVLLLIKAKDLIPVINILPEGAAQIAVLCFTMMVAGMNFITAPAISLEGQSFWITRSLPIKASDILESKISLHKILTVPPAIIMVLLSSKALNIDLYSAVMIAFAVYAFIIIDAQFGLILNLKMPNLEWTNEAVPVKRSLPTVIVLFGSWIFAIIIAGIFFLLRNAVSCSTFIVAVFVIFVLASRFIGEWIRKRGVELYEAI